MSLAFLCVYSVLLIHTCLGANILIYIQSPSYSHQIAFRPLWQELAKKGHRLTLFTTDLMEENENITQVDLSGTYKGLEKYDIYGKLALGENIVQIIASSMDMFTELLHYQLKIVKDFLENGSKFDLVITEMHLGTGLAIAEKLNVPSIGVVSMDAHFFAHDAVGNPTHPVANPDYDLAYSHPLSFKERIFSTLYSIIVRCTTTLIFDSKQEQILEKYTGRSVSLGKIVKDVSMLFINANPIFNEERPLGPKTINIGGAIHFSKPKSLPQDIQEFLDNAHKGLIYFSLGTNIKSDHISHKTKIIILKTLSRLPYQVLWKFADENILPDDVSNIKIMKWIPQQDVLRHKNVKLFITQGGLQSMEEAIFNYVPMIGLPFFGDQYNNVKKMVSKGFGLSFDHTNLEIETFTNAILEVINNPRYKEKTKELTDLILDQPMTGLEKAIWWTEYVIRNGKTEHFRNPSVDLPLYQFYLLDVIAFLFGIIFVVAFMLYKILQLLLCKMSTKKHAAVVRSNDVKVKIF